MKKASSTWLERLKAGYSTEEMGIALDVAATEFFHGEQYHDDGKKLTSEELSNLYSGWLDEYPILSIEDGFVKTIGEVGQISLRKKVTGCKQ